MAMVDASLVLDTIVAVSIAAGAVFAVAELRGMSRDRRTRLAFDIFAHVGTLEYSEQFAKILRSDFKDAKEAEEKCSVVALSMVARYFEGVAMMLRRGLVDSDLIFESLPYHIMWTRMKPWCLEIRRTLGPDMYVHFEWAAGKCQAYVNEKYGAAV
jgi:hypothetical protein